MAAWYFYNNSENPEQSSGFISGDQTDVSANQTNANQNTQISALNAEESESESEAESITFWGAVYPAANLSSLNWRLWLNTEIETIADTPHGQRRKMELERALKFKEVFSGDKSQNIEAFFDRFETWCAKQGHNDEYKLQNIVFCLDGPAYNSYKTMAPELKNNYATLKKELTTYYSHTKLPFDKQYQQVQTLKMKETETVQGFYNLLMKKTQDLDITEAQRQVLFKNALPRYIKRYIKQERPKTLSETLIKAREAEELGIDYDDDGDMEYVKESIKALMTELDAPHTPKVSALSLIHITEPTRLLSIS